MKKTILIKYFLIFLIIFALVLVWNYTPIKYYTDPEILFNKVSQISNKSWFPIILIVLYLISALTLFPVTALNVLCALIFEPITAFLFSVLCCLLSAIFSYALGARLGRKGMNKIGTENFKKFKSKITEGSVIQIAIYRNIPVMPFSMFNMVAGALNLPIHIFLLGTIVGMAPGLLIIAFSGSFFVESFI